MPAFLPNLPVNMPAQMTLPQDLPALAGAAGTGRTGRTGRTGNRGQPGRAAARRPALISQPDSKATT